jgi:GT2 family glycosyltransferase
MIEVSFIIPSMVLKRKKNIKHLLKSLSSLPDVVKDIQENVSLEYEIIVICNGREDKKLIKYLEDKNVDKFCIIDKNAGVSRAWNIGRNLAEGKYLCFVNDDVRIGKNSIESIVEKFLEDKKIGIIGPKGAKWENGAHVSFVGESIPEEADAIAGFCFITPEEIFAEVGGFDINYTPAGFEEIDYCFAVKKAGYKNIVIPNLSITTEPCHGISARNTTICYFNNKITTKDLHERNKSYFSKKWCF